MSASLDGSASSHTLGHPRATGRMLAVAAGLAYPLVSVIGFAAFPEPPGGDVSAAHDPGWLTAHTGSVIAQSYLRSVAAVAFILLTVAVSIAVARHERRVGLSVTALAGGITYAVFLLAAQGTTLAAAFASRDHVDSGSIRLLDDLDQALLGLSSLPAVLLFAAAGTAWRRSPDMPHWFTALTLAGVPLAVLDALSYRGGPLETVGLIGLIYFLLWSLLTAFTLGRLTPSVSAGAPSPTA